MGILDDAIREHLDLKRRHGAQEEEVQILADEAFGPPSRPGDPDFPERPPTGEHATGEVAEPPLTEEEALAGDAEVEGPGSEAPPATAEPVAEEAPASFFDQASDAVVVDQPTVEHPPPAADPGADGGGDDDEGAEEGDFEIGEIELEIDDEFEEFAEPGTEEPEPEAEPEPRAPASEEAGGEAALLPDSAEEAAEPEPEGEALLEETPEFLRDTPEDERLWFEQGGPQDFDFEADEEDSEDGPPEDQDRG